MAQVRLLFYVALGYLCGSVLFATVFGKLFCGRDVAREGKDGNPGTANAFSCGGFWCGVLTLLGDLAKGFLPVFFFMRLEGLAANGLITALVIAAPVVGHAFPLYFGFRGGKGIAVSFGCLLGLVPEIFPLGVLVVCFVFFSAVLRITPHFHRTILTYLCAAALIWLGGAALGFALGFGIITLVVLVRLLLSHEQKEKMKVRLLWMH